jgi:outer membrane protein assembly factor BamB
MGLVGLAAVVALAAMAMSGAAGAAPAKTAASGDWAQWLGADRSGISAETGWDAKAPKQVWKAAVGQGFSTVSVVGDHVFTMGNAESKDTVWCLNAADGKEVWKFSYPCGNVDHPGTRCTPTVDGDKVYTLSHQGDLYCLKAADGKEVWHANVKDLGGKRPTWGYACSPLVLGDKLIIDVGPLVALDKTTGKEVWKVGADTAGYSSPIAFKKGAETLIASFNEAGPVVITAEGKAVAKAGWKTSYGVNAVTPIILGDTLFISSGYNTGAALYQITPGELKQVWKNKNMCNHANNCVLVDGCLYGFNGQVNEGPLTCLDYKTGEKKWAEGSVKGGGLMVADGKLIIMDSGGELVIAEASPAGYKELSKTKLLGGTCWTMPVLAGGRIFCRNEAGELVCMNVSGK